MNESLITPVESLSSKDISLSTGKLAEALGVGVQGQAQGLLLARTSQQSANLII
jgi:hypothetical protein